MSKTRASIVEQFTYWDRANWPVPLPQDGRIKVVVGCGTSYNLALTIAALLVEAGHQALAVPGGEWVERPQSYVAAGSVTVIALSRSGETTETVRAASTSRANGHHVIGITCAPGSSLSQAADRAIEFETHPDEGIVMTASASLMVLAGAALAGHRIDATVSAAANDLMQALDRVDVARYAERTHFVILGGGHNYGVALEGMLKLQEMAICYTQAFHPGEHRHGPVSLIDERSGVVILYQSSSHADEAKLAAELQAKGAFIIGLGGPGDVSLPTQLSGGLEACEVLPALQILGENYAVAKGIDTRAPRNLTKVVMLDQ